MYYKAPHKGIHINYNPTSPWATGGIEELPTLSLFLFFSLLPKGRGLPLPFPSPWTKK